MDAKYVRREGQLGLHSPSLHRIRGLIPFCHLILTDSQRETNMAATAHLCAIDCHVCVTLGFITVSVILSTEGLT